MCLCAFLHNWIFRRCFLLPPGFAGGWPSDGSQQVSPHTLGDSVQRGRLQGELHHSLFTPSITLFSSLPLHFFFFFVLHQNPAQKSLAHSENLVYVQPLQVVQPETLPAHVNTLSHVSVISSSWLHQRHWFFPVLLNIADAKSTLWLMMESKREGGSHAHIHWMYKVINRVSKLAILYILHNLTYFDIWYLICSLLSHVVRRQNKNLLYSKIVSDFKMIFHHWIRFRESLR